MAGITGSSIWWHCRRTIHSGQQSAFRLFVNLGEGFITGNILSFIGVLAAIALMWFINRTLMQKLIYNELNKVEDTRINMYPNTNSSTATAK